MANAAAGMRHKQKAERKIKYKVGDLVLYRVAGVTKLSEQFFSDGGEYIMGCVQNFQSDGIYAEVLWWEAGKESIVAHDIYDVNRFRDNYLQFLINPDGKKVLDF